MSSVFNSPDLEKFIRDGDRSFNPIFVGRDEIIGDIMQRADAIARHSPRTSENKTPAQGQMQLIQGAPGIGKTTLLNRLASRCNPQAARLDNHPYVIPVIITNSYLLSHAHVASCINQALAEMARDDPNARLKAIMVKIRQIASHMNGLQVSMPEGGGAGVSWTAVSQTPGPKPERPDLADLRNPCAVLLMIDEIQTVTPAAKSVLQYLEGGSEGLPILPVLAGLSNSWQVLQNTCLSRLGHNAIIQPPTLSADEVQEALATFIQHFGLTATAVTKERWSVALWQWSKGWPKHVQNALSTMGRHILDANGDLNVIQPVHIQPDIIQIRLAYYRQRLGPWTGQAKRIGQFMAALGRNPVDESHVEEVLHELGFVPDRSDTRSDAMTTMLKLGLLDEFKVGTSRFACPIPSLRSFAVAQTGSPLHVAAMSGQWNEVQAWTQRTPEHPLDAWGRTPLHLAAQENWPVIIRQLLTRGHDLAARDQWQRTPLHVAAGENAHAAMAVMLAAGADTRWVDEDGYTPLHHAAGARAAQAVELLLDYNSPVQPVAHDGVTPLHDAARANAPACLRLLLARGADIQAVDQAAQTPLHMAAQANGRDATEALLEAGADREALDMQSRTPYSLAPANSATRQCLALDPTTVTESQPVGIPDMKPDGPK